MLGRNSKWRLLPVLVAAAAVIAAVTFMLSGTLTGRERASATGGTAINGVSCADVWLGELQNAGWTPGNKPAPVGDPPAGIGFHAAIALTRTYHNTTTHELNSVTQTANLAIPGVIAGNASALVNCARIDKQVADVTGVSVEPPTATVSITATGGNPPEDNMLVYWNSSTSSRKGFYKVTSTDGSSTATLLKAVGALCNNVPGDGDANGVLYACVPVNKPWPTDPYAYLNGDTTTSPSLLTGATEPRAPGGYACPGGGSPTAAACTSIFDKGNNESIVISCAPSTAPAGPTWTRLETLTVVSGSTSEKVPSYGVTQFYTGVDPKTCANNGSTVRSTTYNVVWSLDSEAADGPDPASDGWNSDWDKDGCYDWQELAAPQPVTVAAGGGGRDAFNPFDCARGIDGDWDVTIEAVPITTSDGGNTVTPGSFFRCRAVIDGATMPIYCYRDDPTIDINPEDAPGTKGDGLSGSIWPTGTDGVPPAPAGPYGDVNATHDVWSASYNSGSDTLAVSGCLEDQDGASSEGNVYVETSTDVSVLSGYGEVNVWLNQTQSNCTNGTPAGSPDYGDVAIYMGIQADSTTVGSYDQDLDGCPNSRELSQNGAIGGLRDPFNRYDYYDVSQPKDGVIDLPNDILGVILHFAPGGYPPGDENWDRPSSMTGGAGNWSRAAPDGVIDLPNDILGVILQFNPGGC